jgi:oligoribonuclease
VSKDLRNLCFLDLETTGHDHELLGSILEVGVIITDPMLNTLATAEWLVEPAPGHLDTMPSAVWKMHTRNGLLDRVAQVATRVHAVEADLAALLDRYGPGKLALAGSGVGHYDSRWLRHHMPMAADRLTYWAYDVGVIRRFVTNLLGGEWVGGREGGVWEPGLPSLVAELPPGGKPHRALADAQLHLDEMRHYRHVLDPMTWA